MRYPLEKFFCNSILSLAEVWIKREFNSLIRFVALNIILMLAVQIYALCISIISQFYDSFGVICPTGSHPHYLCFFPVWRLSRRSVIMQLTGRCSDWVVITNFSSGAFDGLGFLMVRRGDVDRIGETGWYGSSEEQISAGARFSSHSQEAPATH